VIFFTSDTHFNHAKVLEHSRRPFRDLDEMTEALIYNWNSVVSKSDVIYHLGDFGLTWGAKHQDAIDSVLKKLNGTKILITGNHDRKEVTKNKRWALVTPYHEIKMPYSQPQSRKIVLCHYALRTWNQCHRGAYMLHGHCLDMESEILTDAGWKSKDQIIIGESLPAINPDNGELVTAAISELHYFPHYSGDVVSFSGKSINFRVTSQHRIPCFSASNSSFEFIPANQFTNRTNRRLLRAGTRKFPGLPWTDAEIRLYVLMAADGAIKPTTNLCRVALFKARKKKLARELLAGTPHKELLRKDGSSSFNFYIPPIFSGIKIKGSDPILERMDDRQFEIFLDTYSQTDGCRSGKGVIIYSSKEVEIDRIQAMAVQRGYGATKYSRINGFSTRPGYQLSVFKAGKSNCSSTKVSIEAVREEPFWCVTCTHSNFFMRRKGKVHLTGNSHGSLPRSAGRILDVGVDKHNYRPISMAEVREFMEPRPIYSEDHHQPKNTP